MLLCRLIVCLRVLALCAKSEPKASRRQCGPARTTCHRKLDKMAAGDARQTAAAARAARARESRCSRSGRPMGPRDRRRQCEIGRDRRRQGETSFITINYRLSVRRPTATNCADIVGAVPIGVCATTTTTSWLAKQLGVVCYRCTFIHLVQFVNLYCCKLCAFTLCRVCWAAFGLDARTKYVYNTICSMHVVACKSCYVCQWRFSDFVRKYRYNRTAT